MSSTIVRLSDETQALIAEGKRALETQGCGVCEKEGGEVFWFSPYSNCAHHRCFGIISSLDISLVDAIAKLFKDAVEPAEQDEVRRFRYEARREALTAIREACRPDTILTFHEKYGGDALKTIFRTSGIPAAIQYAAQTPQHHSIKNKVYIF